MERLLLLMGEQLVERIIEKIADAEGKQPDELAVAIEEYVDTDAIRLLDNHHSTSWTLNFDCSTHTVEVTGRGDVFVDGIR